MTDNRTPPAVLAISGSEREGGNTDQALEYTANLVEQQGGELKIVPLRDFRIAPCASCGDCNSRNDPCTLVDDAPRVIEMMLDAEAIIYATPVHGFGPAHLMQIFLERAGVGYLRFHRPLANKVAGAVVVSRRYSDVHVHDQLVLNMLLNRMIVVGSGFPALLRGGASGYALEDNEGLEALRRMVERMIGMVRMMRELPTEMLQFIACSDQNERTSRMSLSSAEGFSSPSKDVA